MTDQNASDAKSSIPPGFTTVPSGTGGVIIHHRRAGMGCMNFFLVVWLTLWTVGSFVLLSQYLAAKEKAASAGVPLIMLIFFGLGEIGVAGLLIYLLFCRKSFAVEAEMLRVDTRVLGYRRSISIPRKTIRRVIQIKDGGQGKDSFPSWGLKLEGDRPLRLLFRLPYAQSHWLGTTLAKWARVKFVEAAKP